MPQPSLGLLGLDRKKMEEERLARMSKKRITSEQQVDPRPLKKTKVDEPQGNTSGDKISIVGGNSQNFLKDTPVKSGPTFTPKNGAIQYPKGVIKRTWAFGYERSNDIKIEEVLQKQNLNIAVISSFQWDFPWMMTKFTPTTKFVLISQAKNEAEKQQTREEFKPFPGIRLCFPPMSGNAFGSMHSKLMLLFYSTHLRIVVPTANFLPYDWGETGVMENYVFLIDLPRLPEEPQPKEKVDEEFLSQLLKYLEAMGLDEDVRKGVLKFDFSQTADLRLVHTIAGSHVDEASMETGHPGIGQAVRSLDMSVIPGETLEVDYVAASIGALDQSQLETLYGELCGVKQNPPSTSRKKGDKSLPPIKASEKRFRFIFPSEETVQASKGGPESGGTIFCKPEYFNRATFPQAAIREHKSTRKGILSHSKLILARSPSSAFLYLGSANLSQAAWGKLTTERGTSKRKLTASNWECGVLMPVYRSGILQTDKKDNGGNDQRGEGLAPGAKVLSYDVFKTALDLPFEAPPEKYRSEQRPWSATRLI